MNCLPSRNLRHQLLRRRLPRSKRPPKNSPPSSPLKGQTAEKNSRMSKQKGKAKRAERVIRILIMRV